MSSWWEKLMGIKDDVDELKKPYDMVSEMGEEKEESVLDIVKNHVNAALQMDHGSGGDAAEAITTATQDYTDDETVKENLGSIGKVIGGAFDKLDREWKEGILEEGPQEPSERERFIDGLASGSAESWGQIGGGPLRKAIEFKQAIENVVDHGQEKLEHIVESGSEMLHDARGTLHEYITPAPSEDFTTEPSTPIESEGILPLPTDISEGDLGAAMNATGDEFSLQQMYAQMEQTMIEQGATAEDLAEFRSIESQVTDMIDSSTIDGEIDPDLFQQNMSSYLSENGIDPSSYDGDFPLSNPYGDFASTLGEQPTEDFSGSDSTGDDDSDYDDFDDPPGTARAAL
jgi:hypothetical protein